MPATTFAHMPQSLTGRENHRNAEFNPFYAVAE